MLFKTLYVPNRDQCYITYADGAFTLVPLAGNTATRVENNTFYFYKLTCLTEPLYNALQEAKSYATGNPNGAYDPELYAGFEALLLDSIDAYETYNHYLSEEELEKKEAIAAALDTRAASLEAYMDLLSTGDLSAVPDKLPASLGWKNTHMEFPGRNDYNGLDGSYFIVHQNDSGEAFLMDPTATAPEGQIAGKQVQILNRSVVGGDIAQAIDLVYEVPAEERNNHCFFLRTQEGEFLRGERKNNVSLITLGHAHQALGLRYNGSRDRISIYRNINTNADGTSVTAQTCQIVFDGSFRWEPITDVVHSNALHFYRLTWSTEELLSAITEMAAYTESKGSGIVPEVYADFLNCLEESIGMYLKYNVSYTDAQLEQTVSIQTELKAQVVRLLSYKQILASDYSLILSQLPTPYNELSREPMSRYHDRRIRHVAGSTYYIVHLDPTGDGSTGWAMVPDDRLYAQQYVGAEAVEIREDRIVNGSTLCAFLLQENVDSSGTLWANEFRTYPVNNITFNLNNGKDIENNPNFLYAGMGGGAQCSFGIHVYNEGFTMYSGRDFDGDGTREPYIMTYLPELNGFRPRKEGGYISNSDNVFQLYRISSHVLELYDAIVRMACYTEEASVGLYPREVYAAFLSCLQESIELYQYYNTPVLTQWDEAELKTVLDAQAEELLSHIDALTLNLNDEKVGYIDIPVEILDFRADGFMLEYKNNNYGLSSASSVETHYGFESGYLQACTRAWPTFIKADGTKIQTTVSQKLTEPELVDGNMVYTEKTLRQVAYTLLGGVYQQYENIPGQNNMIKAKVDAMAQAASAYAVESEPWMALLGSPQDTFSKTSTPGKNGGELSWGKIVTAYDLAYYILNYLWRPVSTEDDMGDGYTYNVTVPERAVLRLFKDEKGFYTLDAQNWVESTGPYTYNAYPSVPASIHRDSPSFMPIDGLGFEKKGYMEGSPDTDQSEFFYRERNYSTEGSNFHFTVHAKGSFVYYEEQDLYFEFLGDDDVYFYIDGKLVMDLGGGHSAAGDTLDLNKKAAELGLELKDGEIYSFDMFYAERHTSASNLRFSTNMRLMDPDLLTKKSQYEKNT
ncbi:MAG: fibro-slime domain-containing protein, partial [Oscillospiraceae bacterium]|nr:fibro-slime domain-containing protein [Oscillospiraceae bacterium]